MGKRQRNFEAYRDRMRQAAGEEASGTEGDVEVLLKMPDATQVHGRFAEGAPVARLFAAALASAWADSAQPHGLRLTTAAPRRVVDIGETISRDFHRATVLVTEDDAPALPPAPPAAPTSPVVVADEAAAGAAALTKEQEQKVAAVVNLSGTSRAAAEAALAATGWETEAAVNQVLEAVIAAAQAAAPFPQGMVVQPVAPSLTNLASPPAGSHQQPLADREARVQAVMSRTGASLEAARCALEACGWEVEQGVQRALAARSEAQAVLQDRSAAPRAAPRSHRGSGLGKACGAEGPFQHFVLGTVLGSLAAFAIAVCAAVA